RSRWDELGGGRVHEDLLGWWRSSERSFTTKSKRGRLESTLADRSAEQCRMNLRCRSTPGRRQFRMVVVPSTGQGHHCSNLCGTLARREPGHRTDAQVRSYLREPLTNRSHSFAL
ncbi:MAG: hypothetical protein LC808_37945, partial [Actinobacteria bacterium]|nr:hypothetical protein [Actinomycetota bacterium]